LITVFHAAAESDVFIKKKKKQKKVRQRLLRSSVKRRVTSLGFYARNKKILLVLTSHQK